MAPASSVVICTLYIGNGSARRNPPFGGNRGGLSPPAAHPREGMRSWAAPVFRRHPLRQGPQLRAARGGLRRSCTRSKPGGSASRMRGQSVPPVASSRTSTRRSPPWRRCAMPSQPGSTRREISERSREAVILATHEAVANAIQHSGTADRIRVRADAESGRPHDRGLRRRSVEDPRRSAAARTGTGSQPDPRPGVRRDDRTDAGGTTVRLRQLP